jgi:hypothetical protein
MTVLQFLEDTWPVHIAEKAEMHDQETLHLAECHSRRFHPSRKWSYFFSKLPESLHRIHVL